MALGQKQRLTQLDKKFSWFWILHVNIAAGSDGYHSGTLMLETETWNGTSGQKFQK